MSATIYVPQEQQGKNLSAAMKFGDRIVSCLPQDYQVYTETEDTANRIADALHSFETGDYLLLIGDPILIGLTCAIAFMRNDSVKVLKWDAQTRTYVPITLVSPY